MCPADEQAALEHLIVKDDPADEVSGEVDGVSSERLVCEGEDAEFQDGPSVAEGKIHVSGDSIEKEGVEKKSFSDGGEGGLIGEEAKRGVVTEASADSPGHQLKLNRQFTLSW